MAQPLPVTLERGAGPNYEFVTLTIQPSSSSSASSSSRRRSSRSSAASFTITQVRPYSQLSRFQTASLRRTFCADFSTCELVRWFSLVEDLHSHSRSLRLSTLQVGRRLPARMKRWRLWRTSSSRSCNGTGLWRLLVRLLLRLLLHLAVHPSAASARRRLLLRLPPLRDLPSVRARTWT